MKQIFDWLREQINATIGVELFGTKYTGINRVNRIINEAEAKWEADCCEWKYDDEEDYYETSCGHLQIIMGGTPTENGYKFCPYCGRKIVEVE